MTITFKPGQHPDADQLSAFIEQALPAHERDGVLAHLAACAECRAVVALALPEEPAALPAPEPRRSWFSGPWFSNWKVFLPAAAAVAALAAFVFFVHHQGPAPQQQAQMIPAPASAGAPPQLQSSPPAQLKTASPSPQAEIATPAPSPAPKRQVETANASIGSAGVPGSAGAIQPAAVQPIANQPTAPQVAAVENRSVQSMPTQYAANSFASASNNSVSSQNQPAQQASARQNVFHGGAISGTLQSNNTLQQAEANAQNRRQQSGLRQTASQTVQVQAEAPAPVATESAEVSTLIAGRATSNLSFTQQPLPSRLAVLSTAARGPIVLAIDTHHSVFVSNDSGQHWKTVQAVWKGRAVMVEAAVPVRMLALPEPGATMGTLAAMPQGAMAATTAGTILTGTITDQSGAVVPGATVTVTDPRTRLARSITTDANGRYVAAGLDSGSYNLDATAQGFMSSHLSNVAVDPSKENVTNFTLRVGAMAESVTVNAAQATVEPKTVPMAKARPAPAPLFEIVTDKGVRWTSADGVAWQPK